MNPPVASLSSLTQNFSVFIYKFRIFWFAAFKFFNFKKLSSFDWQLSNFPTSKTFQFLFTGFGLSVAAFKFPNFKNFPVLICSFQVFQFQKLSSFDLQLSSLPISKTFQFWFAAFKFSNLKNFPVWFAAFKFSNFKNFPILICSFQIFQPPKLFSFYSQDSDFLLRLSSFPISKLSSFHLQLSSFFNFH